MSEHTVELTSAEFKKFIGEGVALVDFWAAWCGPCKAIAPIIGEVAAEFKGRAKVGKINVDECEDVAKEYGVMSIPTLILFKNGAAAERAVGMRPKAAIAAMIEKHLKNKIEGKITND